MWAFIAPALYKHERRLVVPLWFPALCCFISAWRSPTLWSSAGIWLPCQYRAGRGTGIHRIASYLSFVMALFMAFGVSFECRWQLCCCAGWGLLRQRIYEKTPVCAGWRIRCRDAADAADVFSQTLLAIPMYCLFEIGVSSHAFTLVKGEIGKRKTTLSRKRKN